MLDSFSCRHSTFLHKKLSGKPPKTDDSYYYGRVQNTCIHMNKLFLVILSIHLHESQHERLKAFSKNLSSSTYVSLSDGRQFSTICFFDFAAHVVRRPWSQALGLRLDIKSDLHYNQRMMLKPSKSLSIRFDLKRPLKETEWECIDLHCSRFVTRTFQPWPNLRLVEKTHWYAIIYIYSLANANRI